MNLFHTLMIQAINEYDQSILVTLVAACEKCCQSWICGSVSPSEEVAAYRYLEGMTKKRRRGIFLKVFAFFINLNGRQSQN